MAAQIAIAILANASQANRTLDQTVSRTQKVSNGFRKMGVPAVAALGAITAAGAKAADSAAEDAQSQALLESAMEKSANATDKQVAATEKFIDKTARAKGVADDQLRPAMESLVRATGSVGKSQEDLGLVLDIAAAKHKSVTAVSDAMAKAYGGNTGALGKLFPALDKALLKSGDMEAITAELAKTVGGTAAKAANTEAGAMARSNIARDEAVETIGARLLPVYAKVAEVLAAAANWLAKNEKAAYILVGGIAALAAIVVTVNAAMKVASAVQAIYHGVLTVGSGVMKAAAAAQWLLNVAMSANPIGLVIIAIVALVAGFVLAWKHSETFREIVTKAFEAVKNAVSTAVSTVVNFVKNNWEKLLIILTGPIGAAVVLIVKNWDKITAGAQAMYTAVKNKITEMVEFVKSIPGKITGAIGDLGGLLKGAGKAVMQSLIDGIEAGVDKLKSKLKWVTDIIPNWKGPLSYDKVMLRPAGQAIMDSLIDGIDARESALKSTLSGVSRTVAGTNFAAGVDFKGRPTIAPNAYLGGGGVTQHITLAVEVPLAASRGAVGREIVDALREYAETGGRVQIP